jgi:hypothetical protein
LKVKNEAKLNAKSQSCVFKGKPLKQKKNLRRRAKGRKDVFVLREGFWGQKQRVASTLLPLKNLLLLLSLFRLECALGILHVRGSFAKNVGKRRKTSLDGKMIHKQTKT